MNGSTPVRVNSGPTPVTVKSGPTLARHVSRFDSMMLRLALIACAALALSCQSAIVLADELKVGSKRFTESYILGEIVTQTAREAGAEVAHRQGLGGTAILFEAIKTGAVDVYPDYTGTIARQLLKTDAVDLDTLNRGLKPLGLGVAVKLGFNNTYALALSESEAQRLDISSVSDLAEQPQLRFGLGHEFLERNDGWSGLKRTYRLPQSPKGLDHGLAYEAIASRQIDVMDIYSTDAKIVRYDLRVLSDDKRYFPEYDAVLVYRLDVPERFPRAWAALANLQGRIDAERMIAMNARAELDGASFAAIAADFPTYQKKRERVRMVFWASSVALISGDSQVSICYLFSCRLRQQLSSAFLLAYGRPAARPPRNQFCPRSALSRRSLRLRCWCS